VAGQSGKGVDDQPGRLAPRVNGSRSISRKCAISVDSGVEPGPDAGTEVTLKLPMPTTDERSKHAESPDHR
jgi:hypothetical protein